MTSTSPRIKKPARTLLWVLLDVLLVNASLFLAQVVRYSSNISYSFFENSIRLAPAMTVIFLLVFCGFGDRKSTRLNSSHSTSSRMPSSA